VIEDLVFEMLAPGVHTITFDFFNNETNRYYDYGIYSLSLCYGPNMQERMWISFWESAAVPLAPSFPK
jgi:hypothetical protein